MNVSEKQKMIILDYMRRNPDFARGRLRYNTGNKKILDNMWMAVGNALNASGNGPHKQPKDWQKASHCASAHPLHIVLKNKSYAGGTGGGPPKIIPLTNLEETLLEMIGPESAGLENVPEGGSFDRAERRENLQYENLIPEGGSFDMNNRVPSKRISQDVVEERLHYVKNKKLCASRLATHNEMFEIQNNSPSTSAIILDSENQSYEINLTEQEMGSTNHVDDDDFEFNIQESAILWQRESTEPLSSEQVNHNKHFQYRKDMQEEAINNANRRDGNQSNASIAVELMREKIDLLRQRMKANERFQNCIIEIEKEKLDMLRTQISMRGEMFEYFKNILLEIKDVLTNVDDNVMSLKVDVEKIAPSYLE